MSAANQNPEQRAWDRIDAMLVEAGWTVQSNAAIDFGAGRTRFRKRLPVGMSPYC